MLRKIAIGQQIHVCCFDASVSFKLGVIALSKQATVWQVKLTVCANAGGCQPEHCPGNSAGLRCNQQVKACTVNGQTECEGKKVSG